MVVTIDQETFNVFKDNIYKDHSITFTKDIIFSLLHERSHLQNNWKNSYSVDEQ